jgi:hypothetical protein
MGKAKTTARAISFAQNNVSSIALASSYFLGYTTEGHVCDPIQKLILHTTQIIACDDEEE